MNNYCPQCGTKQEESSLILVDDLKVNEYRNGDEIPKAISEGQWIEFGKAKIGAYSCIEDKDYNIHYLYNWYAVNDERELAPEGWHIPTDEEWNNLENQLKENPTYAGYRRGRNGGYHGIGYGGYFWSSTESSSFDAWSRELGYSNPGVKRDYYSKRLGFSVRCLKEEKGEEKEDSDMGLLIYENKAMAHYLKKLGLDIDDIIFKYKEK